MGWPENGACTAAALARSTEGKAAGQEDGEENEVGSKEISVIPRRHD
jgi:hypothetical protein